jgi:hypothetical protein
MQQHFGRADKIDVRTQPIARISFARPVPIDAAISRCWDWKQFFEQVALQPFSIEAISVRSKTDRKKPGAIVYLPNVEHSDADMNAAYIPLNTWDERKALTAAMRHWMQKQEIRRLFPVAIARVIDRSRKRIALDDVVAMCAAIESLSELDEGSKISPGQLQALVTATQSSAAQLKLDVPPARIQGVLALLQHQSLPRRLTMLKKATQHLVSKADSELVTASANTLRTIAAHGHAPPAAVLPKIAPTVKVCLDYVCCTI